MPFMDLGRAIQFLAADPGVIYVPCFGSDICLFWIVDLSASDVGRSSLYPACMPARPVHINATPTGMFSHAASSGTGASQWGIWRVDPGPRGVPLSKFPSLKQAGGVAPHRWTFDRQEWWLEERDTRYGSNFCTPFPT